jgi:hypothetical protein
MTSAIELVRLAIAFEGRIWIDNDRLELDVPDDFPAGLIQLLREHKIEVLEYLRQHPKPAVKQYRLRYPEFPQTSDQELAEILQTVRRRGLILVWSTTLKDLVAFHRPELDLRQIPPGFVPYSTRELTVLFGQDAALSKEGLRLVHEAKKYGGRVIDDLTGGSF